MSDKTVPDAVESKWPPLHSAIHRAGWGSYTLGDLRDLLKNGADIFQTADTHASTNTTVLHTAADGNAEIVDLLFEFGARDLLETKCGPGEEARFSGHTALQIAAKEGCQDIVQKLIANGANYDIFAAACCGDLERLHRLLNEDANLIFARDDYHASALHWAAAQDQQDAAVFLIKGGIDVNSGDDFAETPLLVASARHSRGMVDTLLGDGAAVDIFAAAALGDRTQLEELSNVTPHLAVGRNSHGTTPLHWAARNGHVNTAKCLLERGADIDAKDHIGCPPLFYAAYWGGHKTMTQFLCDGGADVDFHNIWGKDLGAYDCGGCGVDFSQYRR